MRRIHWILVWFFLPSLCAFIAALLPKYFPLGSSPASGMVIGSLFFLGAFSGARAVLLKEGRFRMHGSGRTAVFGGAHTLLFYLGLLLLSGVEPPTASLMAGILVASTAEEVVFRYHLPILIADHVPPGATQRVLAPFLSQTAFVLAHLVVPGSPWLTSPLGLTELLAAGYFYLVSYRLTSSLSFVIAVHGLVNTGRFSGLGMADLAGFKSILLALACALVLAVKHSVTEDTSTQPGSPRTG